MKIKGITYENGEPISITTEDIDGEKEFVNVVRCKDCFFYRRDSESAKENECDAEKWCGLLRIENYENGFCNYGRLTEDVIAQREARGEKK